MTLGRWPLRVCMFSVKVSWTWRVPTRKRADKLDVELKEPKAWEGLFGVKEGWSGGAGSNAELYG
jgi:hypothetical protein